MCRILQSTFSLLLKFSDVVHLKWTMGVLRYAQLLNLKHHFGVA